MLRVNGKHRPQNIIACATLLLIMASALYPHLSLSLHLNTTSRPAFCVKYCRILYACKTSVGAQRVAYINAPCSVLFAFTATKTIFTTRDVRAS